ncbi:13441_t:CDS:2, partial [Ambispora gerdemannii]
LNNPLMNNQFPNQQTQEQINPQKMTTGQKIPQMSGTMGEIQQGIQTMQMTLGQIIQQQQNLDQRLSNLENSASSQFTNLIQQKIKPINMSFFPDITPLIKEINEFKTNQQKNQAQIIALLEEIRSILLALQKNETKSRKRIESIDTAQLEYTFTTSLTYGTIIFAVVLATGKVAMFTIGLMVGIFLYKAGVLQKPLTSNAENSGEESSETQPNSSDNIAKFQQRQAQLITPSLTKTVQQLSTSLQSIQPSDNQNVRLITYALIATAITGIF